MAGSRCGAHVWRCATCDHSVAKVLVTAGKNCPKCPGAGVVDGTCRQRVGPGERCYTHGAKAGQVIAAKANRALKARAETATRRLAVPVTGTDHVMALQDALDLSHGMVRTLVGLVNDLELVVDEDWTGIAGRTYHQSGRLTGEAKPHVFVVLLNEERDRYAKLAAECTKLGIALRFEERQATVDTDQGRQLLDLLDTALQAIPPEHADTVRRAVAGEVKARLADGRILDVPRPA